MDDDADLPIALRRTRRSLGQATTQSLSPCASPARVMPGADVARTPKSRKRCARFSDPGPDTADTRHAPEVSSTGLTPMVRRTALASSRHTPRRHSTPAGLLRLSKRSGIPSYDSGEAPFSGEIHFLPFRQVLDGRVKRRIRRNGLSEEMNTIFAERKRRADQTKVEIERLKAELAEKDEEIERLHDETVVLDTDRVWGLEQQVAALKRELASRSGVQQEAPSSPADAWMRAARNAYSEDFMELDDEDEDDNFGEATRAELLCSTPTRHRMEASFPTPPATSPEPQLPQLPQTPCRRQFATPPSRESVQAPLPDPDKQRMQAELDALHREVSELTTTLESYSTLTTCLSAELAPFASTSQPTSPSSPPNLLPALTTLLQTLSDRTAALTTLTSTIQTLGFPGEDASSSLTTLSHTLRTARLELEYLTPGELPLPLSGAGEAVLTTLLTRLRALAQKSAADDAAIDEYHAQEQSLRAQLNARVSAMDGLAAQLAGREKRVEELEVAVARLRNAARAYERDVEELEGLVARMEGEHKDEVEALREKQRGRLVEVGRAQGVVLAERDRVVAGLRGEVERVSGGLREVCGVVVGLRVENGRLQGEVGRLKGERDSERRRVRDVMEGVMRQLGEVAGEMEEEGEGDSGVAMSEENDKAEDLIGNSEAVVSEGNGKVDGALGGAGGLLTGERARKRMRCGGGLALLDEEVEDAREFLE
ncbi:hypothetical protein C8A05DRAFT_18968 [Staphylotrichum tortipilum]|uniref:Uncharacterized protein n=1 Tax=Staphylotrichum tortipilum TaxID=2831512 RepID=A0AAN6MDU7_9PEZI|nr:hypothetical protein C8A05DRAFT_18968 [Staphylotrichum longicolle]